MPASPSSTPSLFDDAPTPTDRLFLALRPDADTAAHILALSADLRQQHGLKGRALDAERLHVTLLALGDHVGVPQRLVADVQAVLDTVTAAPLPLCFDRLQCFGRGRNNPIVLTAADGLPALQAFQQQLVRTLATRGLVRPEGTYTPHVTLLYDDRVVATQPVPPVRWTADEFVLVNSHIGQSRHERLMGWPLRA